MGRSLEAKIAAKQKALAENERERNKLQAKISKYMRSLRKREADSSSSSSSTLSPSAAPAPHAVCVSFGQLY